MFSYPPKSHTGIVVFRPVTLLRRLVPVLLQHSPKHQLWIVEPDRIRYREEWHSETRDLNTDKGEVGGPSPPRPTIKSPINTGRFTLSPFPGSSSEIRFANYLPTFRAISGRYFQWTPRQSFPSIALASPADMRWSVLHLTHALGIQRTGRMILFKIIANAALLPW